MGKILEKHLRSAVLTLAAFLAYAFLFSTVVAPAHLKTSAAANVTVKMKIPQGLTMSVPTKTEITFDRQDGTFLTDSTSVTITTNNYFGYTLNLASNTDHTDLRHTNGTNQIPSSLSGRVAAASFPAGNWGYSTDSGSTYYAIPAKTSPKTVGYSSTSVLGETKTVTFGIKFSNSLAAGEYSNTVILSVVANPEAATAASKTIFDISYMQQMTSTICANTTTPTTAAKTTVGYHTTDTSLVPATTLIDTRDSKAYTVRKLADGKCWMGENLALAGPVTLTAANSDVSSDFELIAAEASGTSWSDANAQHIYSYGTAKDNDGNYKNNLYNYYTATAGTVTNTVTTDATSSICPKGWTLPPASGAGSFNNLFSSSLYNYSSGSNVYLNLVALPFTFARSGYYNGSATTNGSTGYYWTSKVISATHALAPYFNASTIVTTSDTGSNKVGGMSIRCISK